MQIGLWDYSLMLITKANPMQLRCDDQYIAYVQVLVGASTHLLKHLKLLQFYYPLLTLLFLRAPQRRSESLRYRNRGTISL